MAAILTLPGAGGRAAPPERERPPEPAPPDAPFAALLAGLLPQQTVPSGHPSVSPGTTPGPETSEAPAAAATRAPVDREPTAPTGLSSAASPALPMDPMASPATVETLFGLDLPAPSSAPEVTTGPREVPGSPAPEGSPAEVMAGSQAGALLEQTEPLSLGSLAGLGPEDAEPLPPDQQVAATAERADPAWQTRPGGGLRGIEQQAAAEAPPLAPRQEGTGEADAAQTAADAGRRRIRETPDGGNRPAHGSPATPGMGVPTPSATGAPPPERPIPAASAADLVREVAERAATALRAGRSRVELALDPPELGRLHLQMVSQAGGLQTRIEAATEAARALLESHLGQLQRVLEQAGVPVQSVSISLRMGLDTQSGSRQSQGRLAGGRGRAGQAAPEPTTAYGFASAVSTGFSHFA